MKGLLRADGCLGAARVWGRGGPAAVAVVVEGSGHGEMGSALLPRGALEEEAWHPEYFLSLPPAIPTLYPSRKAAVRAEAVASLGIGAGTGTPTPAAEAQGQGCGREKSCPWPVGDGGKRETQTLWEL